MLPIAYKDDEGDARPLSSPKQEASLGFYDLIEDRYFSEREIWRDVVRRWKEWRIKELAKDIVDALTTDEELSKKLDAKIDTALQEAEEESQGEDTIEIDWDS